LRDKARKTALLILNTLHTTRKPLDDILDEIFDEGHQSKLDKAFIYRLVYGVLRWQNRIDWIIKHFSHVKIHKIDPTVLNIIRMGLFQIIFLDRVPVSAAVNTSVELSKTLGGAWVVKFVNALLRKASTEYDTVPFPKYEKNPVLSLVTEYSFPEWLIKRWLKRFGPVETKRLCTFLNTIPPITVRTNRLKTDRESLVRLLDQETAGASQTAVSPDGVSFFSPKLPIPQLTSYQKGWFQVQDEAAQLVTLMLNPHPGETVLDACAGLGGKTGHMAQQMKNKGRIIAMDRHRQKLSRLRSEMMHLGVSIVTTNTHDMNLPFDSNRSRMFDRVILDAPCSGLGVLRRNPDAKWVLAKRNLTAYQEQQLSFLDTLTPLVKTDGILVYTVCSIEPEENEGVVTAFLEAHPSFAIDKDVRDLLPQLSFFIDKEGFFRTYPHTANMDGFFAVRLRRIK
jgi:16S rRNA (cytosine967-C5)-methyltransferase